MTLHYRALPDLTGVDFSGIGLTGLDFGPVPASDVRRVASYFVPAPQPTTSPNTPPPAANPLAALSSDYAVTGKRLLDIALGSIALMLAAPVLVLLAALVWIESGNPFYTQERLGQNGKRFRMFKLRTMVPDAATRLEAYLDHDPQLRAEWNRTQKLKHDPRITPIGRLLRKTSMDELPQILNVIKGDMSLVGPRPMLPEQMALYRNPPAYLGLRPGITGLWQVSARNEESFDLRAILDLRYAQRLSLWTDVKIMAATVRSVLRATGY